MHVSSNNYPKILPILCSCRGQTLFIILYLHRICTYKQKAEITLQFSELFLNINWYKRHGNYLETSEQAKWTYSK